MIKDEARIIRLLGNEMPISADGRRLPERRDVSLRWLAGTVLTGITSTMLMGGALFAALDGHPQLAVSGTFASQDDGKSTKVASVVKGDRLVPLLIAARSNGRSVMEVSTVSHEDDKEVVRLQPFVHVKMVLGESHPNSEDYPPFDPLSIFAAAGTNPKQSQNSEAIYGSDVETEVRLKTTSYPASGLSAKFAPAMSADEVEENVRTNGSLLVDGNSKIASLYYVDPRRFAADDGIDLADGLAAKVVDQNVSSSSAEPISSRTPQYADDVIPIPHGISAEAALQNAGYHDDQAKEIAEALAVNLDTSDLKGGDILRVGLVQSANHANIVRASIYRGSQHVLTVARDDAGNLIAAQEPPIMSAVSPGSASADPSDIGDHELLNVYDGIYRSSLSYGMTREMTALAIKLLSGAVDLQAKLKQSDTLEAFFSVKDKNGMATADSNLLYLRGKFGDKQTTFYRFVDPSDQTTDYYDAEGKSARQFLLRNPVPNGVFTSGFGMRLHPILGFARMHTGADWAAPKGTPILAVGDGTVIKAGWDKGGYGNQTLVKHANGYVSSYNHQNGLAKGVVTGATVVQGQVIGWVGTSGESTGPHLHYELIVNGTKVDPLRVRLPGGKALDGEAFATFQKERGRIDALLTDDKARQIASK